MSSNSWAHTCLRDRKVCKGGKTITSQRFADGFDLIDAFDTRNPIEKFP